MIVQKKEIEKIQKNVLAWYKSEAEPLPWRVAFGERQDPYLVLVSEFMLQQTRRAVVKERFETFIQRFPDVKTLAQASIDEVLTLWAGLGYYRRAHFLHEAAKEIEKKGFFPENRKDLLCLSGIGDYTSAAIRSFAFRKNDYVIDGNIQRVMARFGNHREKLFKEQQKSISHTVSLLHPDGFGAEWYQGLMDLGSDICGALRVQCDRCPLQSGCKASRGNALSLKLHKRSVKISKRYMYVMLAKNQRNDYLMERSQTNKLFQGLWTFPYLLCKEEQDIKNWGEGVELMTTTFSHLLTHLHLEIRMVFVPIYLVLKNAREDASLERSWINYNARHEFSRRGFPRWVEKVIDHLEDKG